VTIPLRVQVSTPLPVAIAVLPIAQTLIEHIARAVGHPTNRIWMEQQGTDLVMYFNYGEDTDDD
jgi:hypothetical protein